MGMTRLAWSVGVLWLALLSCSSAWSQAAATASREREALRRVQRELQQTRQEITALKEKAAVLEKEKSDLASDKQKLAAQVGGALARARAADLKGQGLSASLDDAAKQRATLVQEKSALEAQKLALEQQLAAAVARTGVVERELQQTAAQKKQVESALADARQTTVGVRQEVAMCQDRNALLYKTGMDLIAQCRDRSATETVLRLEPFTGIKRVQIENMLEAERDKLEAQRSRP